MSDTRVRRTKEEIVSEIDAKIETHKKNIAALEARKKAILTPKPRKTAISMSSVLKKAKEKGLSAKEIAQKLNISIEE